MKVASLFAGIGGFDLGFQRAGMEVAWHSEIEPFCNTVLEKYWPEAPNFGDIRGVHNPPYADIVCGGFPCQDVSVAGRRAGLDGARSGLWFEFHRILSEVRPAACVIENVPGLLSSNHGADFGVILEGLEELWPGRWGWAILDSQHFGVPQRRRRLYIIAGPRRERIQQVLSLCESGDWYSPPSKAAKQSVAATIRGRSHGPSSNAPGRGGEDDQNLVVEDLANTLQSKHSWRIEDTFIPDVAYTLNARDAKGIAQREGVTTLVAHPVTASYAKGVQYSSEGIGNLIEVTHPLTGEGFDASGPDRGTPVTVIRTGMTKGNGFGVSEKGVTGTLDRTTGQALNYGNIVRRLTPRECERLQGFPDDWTNIQFNGKPASDSSRYKALGNAVTVPVIEYLGKRLMEVL